VPLRSGRDVRQPDRVLANRIVSNQVKRRAGACEVRLAAAQDDWAEVEAILVDKTEVGKTPR